jgi:AcrR family transcriptional regulator
LRQLRYASLVDDADLGIRERKKRRTRRALAEAALSLFAERGYDETTVADIAAAADVSTRTFFSYFRTKEDVLFADADERIEMVREALSRSDPGLSTVEAIRSVDNDMFGSAAGIFGPHRATRARLAMSHPELRAKGLQRLLTAQRELADWLRHRRQPPLDEILAHAVSAALIGALVGATLACIERGDTPERLQEEIRRVLARLEAAMSVLEADNHPV